MLDELPPDVIEPLWAAIGHMVHSWSVVEMCLDYNTAIIFRLAGGRHLDDQLPQALGRKIRFLRRCFKQIEPLRGFADEALGYIDEAKRLSETRHLVVHGSATKYDPDKQAFGFVKLDLTNGRTIHKANTALVPLRKLRDDAVDCQELTKNFLPFTQRLLHALVPEYEGQ